MSTPIGNIFYKYTKGGQTGLLLFVFFLIDPYRYHGINPRPFPGTHAHQFMRQDMQFMEGVVSKVRLTIALVN